MTSRPKCPRLSHTPITTESSLLGGGADIALLRLDAPVSLSHHVQVVSLPPASLRVPEGKMCWVTGWGSVTVHCRFGET